MSGPTESERSPARWLAAVAAVVMAAVVWTAAVRAACDPTEADALGPYYQPETPFTAVLAGPDEAGDRLVVSGRVTGTPDCGPVAGAVIEVWQANAEGEYYFQSPRGHGGEDRHLLRGRVRTDENGYYRIETVVPAAYPLGGGYYRPPHIHYRVAHPDYRRLTTQLYIGEAARGQDPFGAEGRFVQPVREQPEGDARALYTVEFDIVLSRRGGR
jgi:catechol 1,2-dioxygenase